MQWRGEAMNKKSPYLYTSQVSSDQSSHPSPLVFGFEIFNSGTLHSFTCTGLLSSQETSYVFQGSLQNQSRVLFYRIYTNNQGPWPCICEAQIHHTTQFINGQLSICHYLIVLGFKRLYMSFAADYKTSYSFTAFLEKNERLEFLYDKSGQAL